MTATSVSITGWWKMKATLASLRDVPTSLRPKATLWYYTHTVSAIRRAGPHAKAGGPAPGSYLSLFGRALIDVLTGSAARGEVPFDFRCFHGYANDPRWFWKEIDYMKGKLAKYRQLSHVETMIDQWNMDLGNPILDPNFQPAFVLETTQSFYQKGLTRSSYYQIRDYFVDPNAFLPFFSPAGTGFMAHWWNEMPQFDGLYDKQNRARPAYYALKLLSLIKGEQLPVTGTNHDLHAVAARGEPWINVVLWNFPLEGKGKMLDVIVRFAFEKRGGVRLVRLIAGASVNNLEQVRSVGVPDLEAHPLRLSLRPYVMYWIEVTE